jgi:hypothetical protein
MPLFCLQFVLHAKEIGVRNQILPSDVYLKIESYMLAAGWTRRHGSVYHSYPMSELAALAFVNQLANYFEDPAQYGRPFWKHLDYQLMGGHVAIR